MGHAETFGHASGRVYGVAGVAWLNWQLQGDMEAARMFPGNRPGLAADKKWIVKAKNLK